MPTIGPPDATPTPRSGPPSADQRGMARPYLRLQVWAADSGAYLGRTRDATADGLFLQTATPLPVGAKLPVRVEAASGAMRAELEVVRQAEDGVGARLVGLNGADRRKLRRELARAGSVEGARAAAARVLDPAQRTAPLFTDPARIAALLGAVKGGAAKLVLQHEDSMYEATLDDLLPPAEGAPAGGLRFRMARGAARPPPHQPLWVTLDHTHRSYAFALPHVEVDGRELRAPLPQALGFADRRGRSRRPVEGTRLLLRLPVGGELSFPVVEVGPAGLSFRSSADRWLSGPGAALPEARIVDADGERPLLGAQVASVIAEPEGIVRVGVSLGPNRHALQAEGRTTAGGWWAQTLDRAADLGLHLLRALRGKRRKALAAPAVRSADRQLRFPNRAGLEVQALLDLARPDAEDGAEMPLLIVVPGFGGRKEQMAQLALTVTEAFARQHADVAVLRFDGTNNLGASEKDPGNEADGKHTLHYRLSGVIDDLAGALRWAETTPRLRPTEIIVMSVSFAACALMSALARGGLPGRKPSLWISYMGAPEPRDAVLHVSGHHDPAVAGGPAARLVTLIGCLVDGERFWQDVQALGLGGLQESEAHMAQIDADVLWIAGQHDGWMDLARVRRLMEVAAPGARRLVVADSGHVPRTGGEARRQFALIAQALWWQVHRSAVAPWSPPLSRLVDAEAAEWAAVRSAPSEDSRSFWRRYLLADGGLGFDVLAYIPSYSTLIDSQAERVAPRGLDVLELGAGTGNLTQALAARMGGEGRLVVVELVPEAIARLHEKVPGVEAIAADLDGCPKTAARRFAAGDLRTFSELRGRLAVDAAALSALDRAAERSPAARAALSAAAAGRPVDLSALVARGALEPSLLPAIAAIAGALHAPAAAGAPDGLPFADASFDRVAMSLVLSYLQQPADLLAEIRRVLRPGGELVLSSMVRDADTSTLFSACIDQLRATPAELLGGEAAREALLTAARRMLDAGSELLRLEEEGRYRFYDGDELAELLSVAGFTELERWSSFGEPAQAVCLRARR